MSATTSVDHEWAHDESTNRSAEKHRKNRGKLGVSKGGLVEGSAEEGKSTVSDLSKCSGPCCTFLSHSESGLYFFINNNLRAMV